MRSAYADRMSEGGNDRWTVEWRFRPTDPWQRSSGHDSLDAAVQVAEARAREGHMTTRVRGDDGTIGGEWHTRWRVEIRRFADEDWQPLSEHDYLPDAYEAAKTFARANDAVARVASPEGRTYLTAGREWFGRPHL
jgi:hypothetical protein